jgi:hypothetical protein
VIPENTFFDSNTDPLTLSVLKKDKKETPDWIVFDSDTNTFTGQPGFTDRTTLQLTVYADDKNGGIKEAPMTIIVTTSSELIVQVGLIIGLVILGLVIIGALIFFSLWYKKKKRGTPFMMGSATNEGGASDIDEDEEESFYDMNGEFVDHLKKTAAIKPAGIKMQETMSTTGQKIGQKVSNNIFMPRKNIDTLYSKDQTLGILSPFKAMTIHSRNGQMTTSKPPFATSDKGDFLSNQDMITPVESMKAPSETHGEKEEDEEKK